MYVNMRYLIYAFCDVTSGIYWKILATDFLCFIAGERYWSVNIVTYMYMYLFSSFHKFRNLLCGLIIPSDVVISYCLILIYIHFGNHEWAFIG